MIILSSRDTRISIQANSDGNTPKWSRSLQIWLTYWLQYSLIYSLRAQLLFESFMPFAIRWSCHSFQFLCNSQITLNEIEENPFNMQIMQKLGDEWNSASSLWTVAFKLMIIIVCGVHGVLLSYKFAVICMLDVVLV